MDIAIDIKTKDYDSNGEFVSEPYLLGDDSISLMFNDSEDSLTGD